MKKRIFSAFLAVLMIALLLPVQAFAAESVKGAYVGTPFENVIDTVMGAKSFSRGGTVPEGMKLSGTWSYKNTYGDYEFKLTLSGTPTKAGTYNFSVKYIDENGNAIKTIDYVCVVGEKAPFDFVHSINIDKWPTKLVYYKGDRVDLTGMKVSATVYILNADKKVFEPTEIDVTDMVWVDPEVFTSDEAQDVVVKLKAPSDQHGTMKIFEDSFRVTFKYANPNDVTRIEIYQKPAKLTYTVGERLDTAGMTVRLHKGNGSAEDITSGFTVDVQKLEETGTKTVTVKYTQNGNEFTATFDVKVNEKVEEPVSSSSSSKEEPSSSESSSAPVEETSSSESSSESSESVPEPVEEPSSSEPEEEPSSSEAEEIQVIGGSANPTPVEDENEGGIPFWVWIIIGLLVILIAAAVALFLIGRKRLDD